MTALGGKAKSVGSTTALARSRVTGRGTTQKERAGYADPFSQLHGTVRERRTQPPILRREATERTADVAFAQPLQRTITQLTHALACHAEHRADLLERVLSTTLETEIQSEYLRIARRQRTKRLFNFVVQEAIHRFLFRIRHLVGDESLDERPIAFR